MLVRWPGPRWAATNLTLPGKFTFGRPGRGVPAHLKLQKPRLRHGESFGDLIWYSSLTSIQAPSPSSKRWLVNWSESRSDAFRYWESVRTMCMCIPTIIVYYMMVCFFLKWWCFVISPFHLKQPPETSKLWLWDAVLRVKFHASKSSASLLQLPVWAPMW